jgi:hypothetical protein
MRLPKQTLPKEGRKHSSHQAKHKKSTLRLERREEKDIKKSSMDIDITSSSKEEPLVKSTISLQESLKLREERKKLNRKNVLYKKQSNSISGINGPRAVTK